MEKIINEAKDALGGLKNLLSKIEESDINKIPFEGSWTAGQLAEHMALSNAGFVEMINGPVKETNKPADLMVVKLKEIFLNFNTKMDSPAFIFPADKVYDKNELLDRFESIQKDLVKSVNELDLTKTCTSFELPNMGFLTRLEAVYFVIYHTQRHTHQLKNIYLNLN
ncbi:DinB family protein [Pedobacter frigidisoli]|uniref:DinB family protein n=1 Tax=Pedobacter frigidisoli TaxID=2530455 RepID=A0A4R0P5A4_9SPHI|nr:DinB family protein [Pedobacter frigidisoli]TCD12053.1 DinB family protein [Pedobacter frigidisoli]